MADRSELSRRAEDARAEVRLAEARADERIGHMMRFPCREAEIAMDGAVAEMDAAKRRLAEIEAALAAMGDGDGRED